MKTIIPAIMVLVTLSIVTSCTPKMSFTTSALVPAATGDVKVKKDKNKNYLINVSVQNLADPKRLSPSKETYVVWMESGREPSKKLGQLKPASKSLKASLNATETTQPTDVFITAEDNADVQYPDGQVVLTTKK